MAWTDAAVLLTAAAAAATAAVGVYQTKQLRKQLIAQLYAEYTRRYRETTQRWGEEVNSPGFMLEAHPTQDRDRLLRAMREYFDLCFEEWHLQQLGLINQRVWADWSAGISTAMSRPAFRQAWQLVRTSASYPPTFVEDLNARGGKPTN
jgi:hypothetical protein